MAHRLMNTKSNGNDAEKNYAVLGIGNTLLGDEGVGVHVVENLRSKYCFSPEISLINGGCGGLNLYFILEQYDTVIIVDSLMPNAGVPGSTKIFSSDLLTGKKTDAFSAHCIGIKDALMLLQALARPPEDIILIGVVPAVLKYNLQLSSLLAQSLPLYENAVLQQLQLRNIKVLEQ